MLFVFIEYIKRELLCIWDLVREIAKSIEPGQPAQSAQADHGRNVSLLADFLCIK